MKILSSADNVSFEKPSALVLGDFDGVHTGHRTLINQCNIYAQENSLVSCVYTFENSAKYQLDTIDSLLCTEDEKREILSYCGSDFVYNEKFEDVRTMSPEEFCEYLCKKFNCSCVFCGDNFRFGKGGVGTPELLCNYMQKYDCKTVVLPLVVHDGKTVSSTYIRSLVKHGDVFQANMLLGRPYSICSDVIHGNNIGHTLGFPTVNQALPKQKAVPSNGVYATKISVDDKEYVSVTNIGLKPTVSKDNTSLSCETYILDFDKQVYGKQVTLKFYKKLRDEKKFDSIETLRESISQNVTQTLEFFKKEGTL